MGLRVTIETRLKWTDFQDIHFNPAEESYKQKENSETSFITVASNHPKTIIKQLPVVIKEQYSQVEQTHNRITNQNR